MVATAPPGDEADCYYDWEHNDFSPFDADLSLRIGGVPGIALSPTAGAVSVTSPSFNVTNNQPFTLTLEWVLFHTYGSHPDGMNSELLVSLPTVGGVFVLPAGYTANAPSANIVDNQWLAVPEPGAALLAALGLAGALGRRRRRA